MGIETTTKDAQVLAMFAADFGRDWDEDTDGASCLDAYYDQLTKGAGAMSITITAEHIDTERFDIRADDWTNRVTRVVAVFSVAGLTASVIQRKASENGYEAVCNFDPTRNLGLLSQWSVLDNLDTAEHEARCMLMVEANRRMAGII